jgi:hypothetical protein
MAYTILNSDGTTLLLLTDNSVDQVTTSLSLVGKNISNYGEYINNNFIKLLESFSSTYGNPPVNPVTGQLWYNTTAQRLYVYDKGFNPVSGAIVSGTQPGILNSGAFWWDSTNNQLKLYNNNALYTVGPIFPQSVGSNGWVLPATTLLDATTLATQQVTLLNNYGTTVGVVSNSNFSMTAAAAQTYFSTSTATVVAGLTINGGFKATGQVFNRYLSASVSIDSLDPSVLTTSDYHNVSLYASYQLQNRAIASVLSLMYPVTASTSTNEVGVPLGSEARVICQFSKSGSAGISGVGTQVRRFQIQNNALQGVSWQPVEIYSTGTKYYSVITTSTVNIIM